MRTVVIALVAGCGRFGFGDRVVVDAAPIALDAPTRDGVALDAPPVIPGLLARYSFEDDPADGVIDDTSGGGHWAICTSCPTWIAGHRGMAAAFDGTQLARVQYGSWLATPTSFSYAAWIRIDMVVDQVAFGRPYASGALDAWDLVAWSDGTGTCLETVDASGNRRNDCGPMLAPSTWHHVAARWDGQATALFIDGMRAASTPATIAEIDAHDAIIGADENGGTPAYFWHGAVDELELYDRALTDVEISTLAAR